MFYTFPCQKHTASPPASYARNLIQCRKACGDNARSRPAGTRLRSAVPWTREAGILPSTIGEETIARCARLARAGPSNKRCPERFVTCDEATATTTAATASRAVHICFVMGVDELSSPKTENSYRRRQVATWSRCVVVPRSA